MKPTYEELEQQVLEMAVQLANAESKCRELAVDNASLKNPENWLLQSDYGYEASEVATQNGATEDESLRAGMIAIINRIGTPATDAFLAEVRAHARNELIDELESRFNEMTETLPPELRSGAAGAAAFVSTFRKGAAL